MTNTPRARIEHELNQTLDSFKGEAITRNSVNMAVLACSNILRPYLGGRFSIICASSFSDLENGILRLGARDYHDEGRKVGIDAVLASIPDFELVNA